MTRERPRLAEPKGKAKTLRQKDRIRTGLRKVHAKEDAHQRGNRCKTGNLSGSGASSIRRFHFFFEEELCQARQRPQGILCVFPRAITQHGAIVPGKEGMVLWKKRLRRRQKDQRGLSASLFAQKQRYCASPSGGIPASRCRWQRKRGRDFRSRAIGGPLRSRPGNGNCGKVDSSREAGDEGGTRRLQHGMKALR